MGVTLAIFQVVEAPIEDFTRVSQLIEVTDDGVFNQLVAGASGFTRHLLKLGFHVRGETHFHL